MSLQRPSNRPPGPRSDLPPVPAPALKGLRPVPTVAAVPTVPVVSVDGSAVAAKTTAEYLARRAAATQANEASIAEDDESDERPSDARLRSFAEKIAERYKTIKDIFEGTPYDPTKNTDFNSFLNGQVAETAMRFARTGIVHAYDADAISPDERMKKLQKKGFAVGEAAKGAANEKAADAIDGKEEKKPEKEAEQPSSDDLAFMQSPAMRAALEMGMKLDDDD
jgi:hypothetical protein